MVQYLALKYYSSKYKLLVNLEKKSTSLIMKLSIGTVNTRNFPETLSVLSQELPSILLTSCFNQEKLTFLQEVRKTEIGHLFEHILLEYLCITKLSLGFDEAEYNGRTNWNWIKDPKGTFYIKIDIGRENSLIFIKALNKSIRLLDRILNSRQNLKPQLPVLTKINSLAGSKNHPPSTLT